MPRTRYAVGTAVGNAMSCHHTGYDRHDINIPKIEKRKESKRNKNKEDKSEEKKKKKKKYRVEETNCRAPPAGNVANTSKERAGRKKSCEG